jgi:4-carboxymuconolactone decarboxylase
MIFLKPVWPNANQRLGPNIWKKTCGGAINNGVTKDEIHAIIHVIGIYCGALQALEYFRTARKMV